MAEFVNIVWSGIWLGSAYGALAVALVISYRAARVVNMAIGALFIFAALLAQELHSRGVEMALAVLAAVAAAMALATAQEHFVLRRISGAQPQILLLGTLAVAIALSGVTAVAFGRDPVTGSGVLASSGIRIGGWSTDTDEVIMVAATLALVAVAWRIFERSATGKAITAVGVDPGAAQMLGISVWRWRLVAMASAGLLAGAAGALFLPLGVLDFSQGLSFTLYGFVAAAIAGYYGVAPALCAGWAFGIVSAIGTAYVSSVFSQAVTFGILAAAVLVGQRIGPRTVLT